MLPRELRERDGILSGCEFDVERVRAGEYRLVRRKKKNTGLVDRLLACPEKDWFVPIASESTESL